MYGNELYITDEFTYSMVHRQYMSADIQLRVYDNRLSIWNEGGLPTGMSSEQLKEEHNSRPRNPLIAKACFMAGYIETWGRGTLKIINSCRAAGLPEPEITEKDGGVEVVLWKKADPKTAERLPNDFLSIAQRLPKYFSSDIITVVEVIYDNPEYTAEQIGKSIGKSSRTIRNYLKQLKDAGVIIRKGPKLGGRWDIIVDK